MITFEDLSEDDIADIVSYLQLRPGDPKAIEHLAQQFECSAQTIMKVAMK